MCGTPGQREYGIEPGPFASRAHRRQAIAAGGRVAHNSLTLSLEFPYGDRRAPILTAAWVHPESSPLVCSRTHLPPGRTHLLTHKWADLRKQGERTDYETETASVSSSGAFGRDLVDFRGESPGLFRPKSLFAENPSEQALRRKVAHFRAEIQRSFSPKRSRGRFDILNVEPQDVGCVLAVASPGTALVASLARGNRGTIAAFAQPQFKYPHVMGYVPSDFASAEGSR